MRASRLWLWLFPLLYLPTLGFVSETAYGTLEISDFLIGPYILLVSLAVRRKQPRHYQRLWPWMLYFVLAAAISTITIWWRFPITSSYPVTFGLLKVGKLSLYGVAGLLTARALSLDAHRLRFDWALLVGALVVAASLHAMPDEISQMTYTDVRSAYSATNATSVMMAIMLVYLIGRVVVRANRGAWHRAALWLLPFIALGFMLSQGRGGWVAALAGLMFLFYKVGMRRQVLLAITIGIVTIGLAYSQYPTFKNEVDKTLWPDQEYLERYDAGIGGVDDGGRISMWMHEAAKFPRAAFLGAGFFHRGSVSKLWTTGSHNFWLQVLLETGILGFGVLCVIGWKMWRQAGVKLAERRKLSLPVRAAFVAAFVGGLSGQYLYGGMVLFTLLAVYATIGGLPTAMRHDRVVSQSAGKFSIPALQ